MYQERILNLLAEKECKIDEALERMLEDEEMLVTCIFMVLEDQGFETLGNAILKEDVREAFEIAHSLKGITGNTGLNPLFLILSKMVEELRKNTVNNCATLYKELLIEKEVIEKVIK